MERLLDKIILLCICCFLAVYHSIPYFHIVPLLTVLCISGYRYLYPDRKENYLFLILYILLAIRYLPFLCYLPIIFYDWYDKPRAYSSLLLLPCLFHLIDAPVYSIVVLCCFLPAVILKQKTDSSLQLQRNYLLQRDATTELNILMAQKNKELMIRQNQEIHIATLNERNRIARDIHDTIGHLLSSSLLQIGAIQTMNEQEALKDPIQNIKLTLTSGLDSIRKSVHDMHKDAIDLEAELQKLCQDFSHISIDLLYDVMHDLTPSHTFHVIAIVKEALHNIMKHSNAKRIRISLREQPVFYQLIIHDDGTDIKISNNGIGLENMKNRVDEMHGYFNYQYKHGFEIFITIPKEKPYENHNRR